MQAPTHDGLASEEYLRLGRCSMRELEQLLVRGSTPTCDEVVGWEWRGMNVAFWTAHSPIQKFIKGFYRGARPGEAGQVYGYNEPVVQNGPGGAWIAKPHDDAPKRFGFYLVHEVDPEARDNAYLHALLLDYSKGGNMLLHPANRLRDYIVRLPDSDLMLGKAYLAFGRGRIPTNYFLLERHRPTDFVRS